MRARRAAGKLTKLVNEVRLVGVAACGRRPCSARRRVEPVEHPQRVLESRDAREALRRDADEQIELPLEMPTRQADLGGDAIDRHLPATADDPSDRMLDARIDAVDMRLRNESFQDGRHCLAR